MFLFQGSKYVYGRVCVCVKSDTLHTVIGCMNFYNSFRTSLENIFETENVHPLSLSNLNLGKIFYGNDGLDFLRRYT